MSAAKHTPSGLLEQADALVAAYASAPRRYVLARRDAALIQAGDARLNDDQVAYWKRVADGCTAIAKATGSAS